MNPIWEDVGEVLFEAPEIAERVGELAAEINHDYGEEADVNVLAIMHGAMVFAGALLPCLDFRARLHAISSSSYVGKSTAPKHKPIITGPAGFMLRDLAGAPVLVIDDILDQGHTLTTVWNKLFEAGVRHVKTCVLLRKRVPGRDQPKVDYVGFDIPDKFVVGYGLDYDGLYRNLPFIGVLKPACISA